MFQQIILSTLETLFVVYLLKYIFGSAMCSEQQNIDWKGIPQFKKELFNVLSLK